MIFLYNETFENQSGPIGKKGSPMVDFIYYYF